MDHESFSDEEYIEYVFSTLDVEKSFQIDELCKTDELARDFVQAIRELKKDGKSSNEILLQLQSYRSLDPEEIRMALAQMTFEKKFGKIDPR
ncbi:MAG: hypothetical protein JWM20_525 [Patescibacteria group bacterium]|nr:hypothetical protein [Patescibacteria group bacterium]